MSVSGRVFSGRDFIDQGVGYHFRSSFATSLSMVPVRNFKKKKEKICVGQDQCSTSDIISATVLLDISAPHKNKKSLNLVIVYLHRADQFKCQFNCSF